MRVEIVAGSLPSGHPASQQVPFAIATDDARTMTDDRRLTTDTFFMFIPFLPF
jgi:hypothetical protein